MKIIQMDNFGNDVSDLLIAEDVHKSYIKSIVKFLNAKYSGNHSENCYKAVEDSYELYKYNFNR